MTDIESEEANGGKTWEDLAGEATKETDPKKLLKIVKDLCSALAGQSKPPANSQATSDQNEHLPSRRNARSG